MKFTGITGPVRRGSSDNQRAASALRSTTRRRRVFA